MFIDSGKIVGLLGKEPPLMTSRKEIKISAAREEWRKINCHRLEKNLSSLGRLKLDYINNISAKIFNIIVQFSGF